MISRGRRCDSPQCRHQLNAGPGTLPTLWAARCKEITWCGGVSCPQHLHAFNFFIYGKEALLYYSLLFLLSKLIVAFFLFIMPPPPGDTHERLRARDNSFSNGQIPSSSNGSTPHSNQQPVLIIGGGITGLLLAQALKSSTPPIPFRIFERDPTPDHRGAGWGLTVHWALEDFLSLVPKSLQDRLPETYVDLAAVEAGENGNFLLYNLETGEEMYRVPPARRMRVSRERLRKLLMTDVNIEWNKCIASFDDSNPSSITATFTDGTKATGSMMIGADGSRSRVRQLLCGDAAKNNSLPIRILGASVPYTRKRCAPMRSLDPFFFQCTDPLTSAFLWFSFLTQPQHSSNPDDEVVCQILVSWPYRAGFRGHEEAVETPELNWQKVEWMKSIASGWKEPFMGLVNDIPQSTEIKVINLEDWVPGSEGRTWDNRGGRVTLVGDAAHAMTMFRGEAANHGIKDIACLYREVFAGNQQPKKAGIEAYEKEMVPRTSLAVLNSRKACMDAHDHESIDEHSPLVAKRAVKFEQELLRQQA